MTPTETPAEALARIQSKVSQNDMAAVMQFYACGIHPDDITPRVNVLTFKAWKALGRRVAKGATGQKVCVWIPVEKNGKPDGVRPLNAVLFHECQTVADDAEKGTRPAAWNNPKLVKEGTYDAIETETDEHAQELADISHAEYKAEAAVIDVEFRREPLRLTWTPPEPAAPTARRIEAPKTVRRQLAMF